MPGTSPAVFTITLTVAGVTPEVADRLSQFPPEELTFAIQFKTPPPVRIVSCWGGGLLPRGPLKLSDDADSTREVGVTVKVTVKVCGVFDAPAEDTETVAE